MQTAGKIRHIGISETTVTEYELAKRYATIVSVQNRYNVEDREAEDMLNACERESIAFLPCYPSAGQGSPWHPALKRIAVAHHATKTQIALA